MHLSPRVLTVSPMYSSLQAMLLLLLSLVSSILGMHECLFNGCVSFEVYPNAIPTTDVLETFHYSFCIWYDYLSYCGIRTLAWVYLYLHLDCCWLVFGCHSCPLFVVVVPGCCWHCCFFCCYCYDPVDCCFTLCFVPC